MENKRFEDLKKFLKEKYQGMQAFNSRNLVGDDMTTVYEKDGITVDECHFWGYIEILGISDDEFHSLVRKNDWGFEFIKGSDLR